MFNNLNHNDQLPTVEEYRSIIKEFPNLLYLNSNLKYRVIQIKCLKTMSIILIYYQSRTVWLQLNHPFIDQTRVFKQFHSIDELKTILSSLNGSQDSDTILKSLSLDEKLIDEEIYVENIIKQKMEDLDQLQEYKRLTFTTDLSTPGMSKRKMSDWNDSAKKIKKSAESYPTLRVWKELPKRIMYHLQHPINVSTLELIKSIKLVDNGSVVLFKTGTVSYTCVSNRVIDLLESHQCQNIQYLSFGLSNQFYIRKRNGKQFYLSCDQFHKQIHSTKKQVEFVSFGDYGNWYIQYEDKSCCWSDDLPKILQTFLTLNLRKIKYVWLGANSQFLVIHEDQLCFKSDNLNSVALEILEKYKALDLVDVNIQNGDWVVVGNEPFSNK